MGTPKHLLKYNGNSWLGSVNTCLAAFCDEIVVVGQGELPGGNWSCVADIPGCSGPLAGVLAVIRQYPQELVLVCACDMPEISSEALAWLIAQLQDDDWALIPQVADHHQPLFALYDPRIRPFLEDLAQRGIMKIREVCSNKHVRIIRPPLELSSAWSNINDPLELQAWREGHGQF